VVTEKRVRAAEDESLSSLLGGRSGALDATVGPVVFVLGWLLAGQNLVIGSVAAVMATVVVTIRRLRLGGTPRAAVLSVLGTLTAAVVAAVTGRPEDFFLVQLAANGGSAVAWTVSVLVRWPLLGLVVGGVVGQRTRWRRDPVLLRAYGRASWVWVGQYMIRIVVFGVLWWAGAVVALGVARLVLTWPLIVACLATSWLVIRRVLTAAGHPGIRHIVETNSPGDVSRP
jgi:hypothetical protein